MRREPEENPDEVHERPIERVCAIDEAKESGKVCTRVPREPMAGREGVPGRRVSRVWDVPATSNAVLELAGHLAR